MAIRITFSESNNYSYIVHSTYEIEKGPRTNFWTNANNF